LTLSNTSIQDSIRNAVLAAGTNERVIFYRPNAPRPQLPYTSIQYLSNVGEIGDFEEFDQDDNQVKTFGNRAVTYTMNCYGDNAPDEVNTLQGSLRSTTVRAILAETVKIRIWNLEAIRDLSLLVDSGFEERAAFDMLLNIPMENGTTSQDLGYFDTVDDIEWSNANDLEG
jgi:hypothetical protein